MQRDQNTQNPIKSLFVIALASTILLIAAVVVYLSSRQASFANIQPYHIEVRLHGQDAGQLIVEYNYGYGFNAGHQQIFKLTPNQPQTINFTVSAWKELQSLRVNSSNNLTLDSLMINHNGIGYQALEFGADISEKSSLELHEIPQKLFGTKG